MLSRRRLEDVPRLHRSDSAPSQFHSTRMAALQQAMLMWGFSPVVAATAASQNVQQAPVGRAAFASVYFLSVLLLLWLLSPWTPHMARVLLESASVASLSAALKHAVLSLCRRHSSLQSAV